MANVMMSEARYSALKTAEARLEEAERALREICAVDKAAPGRKDCHIWADMLEIAASYFPDRQWRLTSRTPTVPRCSCGSTLPAPGKACVNCAQVNPYADEDT